MKKRSAFLLACLMLSSVTFANTITYSYENHNRVLSEKRTVNKIDLSFHLDQIFEKVGSYIQFKGFALNQPPFMRILNETATTFTFEAGYLVTQQFPGTMFNNMSTNYLPAGRVLSTIHVGPYETLSRSYNLMENYMYTYGYYAWSTPWEIYLDDPNLVPAHLLRTRIVWPVSPIAP